MIFEISEDSIIEVPNRYGREGKRVALKAVARNEGRTRPSVTSTRAHNPGGGISKKQSAAQRVEILGAHDLESSFLDTEVFDLSTLATSARPARAVEDAVSGRADSDDAEFPSDQVARIFLLGHRAWLRSYHRFVDPDEVPSDAISELPTIAQAKRDVQEAVEQAISALSSIARARHRERVWIGSKMSLDAIFSDIVRRNLPPIVSEHAVRFEKLLAAELASATGTRPMNVDYGQLAFEDGALWILVRRDIGRRPLVGVSDAGFVPAILI